MSSSSFVALSRTARAGAYGKNDHRLSADIPEQLMDDISEALEAYREHVPTATRSEIVREILDHDLNGRIAALTRAFPGARSMGTEAAVTALAALEGKTDPTDDARTLIVPLSDEPPSSRDPMELQPLDQTLRYRDAPRIPRNTEPCPLWQFALIAGLILLALCVAGAGLIYGLGVTLDAFDSYATAFLRSLVRWAQ